MTGLLMAESQERAPDRFVDQTPPAPVRQPSKEDLELAHQLVQHSEGRRDSVGGSFKVDHSGFSNGKAFDMGSQNGFSDVRQMVESAVERAPNRQSSSAEESQPTRRHPGQILNAPTMGQVCRYDMLRPNIRSCSNTARCNKPPC